MYSPIEYRIDGIWGGKRNGEFFPLRHLDKWKHGIHASWKPQYFTFAQNKILLPYNMYHLNMASKELRMARYKKLQMVDPAKSYDYLIDEIGITLNAVSKKIEDMIKKDFL